ncbi:MAG: hypothetical protein IJY87_02815 [Bacilli bacterium]|nr:hypothetical protein [Bacilli bacterium]
MTFTYEGADLSTAIKSFSKMGCNYHIIYMDGSESQYYCSREDEEERLYNIMLEQALERNAKMNLKELEVTKEILKLMMVLSSYLYVLSLKEQEITYSLISVLAGIFSIKSFRERRKKLKELQKYQIFIEIMDRIKCVNETELLKCVEFDTFYQKPLDLRYLDEYTLGDVKRIRNELPKLEQKTGI